MHRRFQPGGRKRPGFTLIEMAVVLTLTGIIAALAYPRIDASRYKADSVVTAVRSVMQQAQRASLVSQHDVIVSFDLTSHRVRVVWDANNDHLIGVTERVTWTTLTSGNRFATPPMGIHGTVESAVVGSNIRLLTDMPTVTFHRDGSLSSDLEIYMSTVALPVRWRAVTVVQATGRTDWYRKGLKDARWVAGVL
jgi:prepilin-type N-terminal cleavage/methylation domain-containing protein